MCIVDRSLSIIWTQGIGFDRVDGDWAAAYSDNLGDLLDDHQLRIRSLHRAKHQLWAALRIIVVEDLDDPDRARQHGFPVGRSHRRPPAFTGRPALVWR
jgi:hypothetical protein